MRFLLTFITIAIVASSCLPRPKRPVLGMAGPFTDSNNLNAQVPEEEPPTPGTTLPPPDPSGPLVNKNEIPIPMPPISENPAQMPSTTSPKTDPVPPVSTPPAITPMPVPMSNSVVYRPLGKTAGGYRAIKEAKWPDTCVSGDTVPTTGALFPFTEAQKLILRGPLVFAELVIYQKKSGSTNWTRIADLSSLNWEEDNYGTAANLGKYPLTDKLLENGREIFTQLPESGEKIVVFKVKMPKATTAVYAVGDQNDVPAVWMLNSKIFQAPSTQYFCNCRGMGNPGGCGELDIAEIIPENKDEVTTTLYSYEGARGGKLSGRPTTQFQVYAAVLRNDAGTGEVAILEASSFDFSKTEITDSFVSKDWLPSARRMNAGSEALIPPDK